ncbi:MAG: 6,7-dimethyl-8-ribityllumazine synthase [Deltaproteobacteria bacterium]|nr:6,7-dimethyl-8-ribityllumazine synthase [Deltaproteobacteria bacterium]
MPRVLEGKLVDKGGRYAIVAARFNELVVERLVAGAVDTLLRHGVEDANIDVVRVPGSFELGVTCQRLARSGDYDAVIALGCVIRGGTAHFEHVAGQAASGVQHAAMASGLPVIFGVLTTENVEQALDRAGLKMGNKGSEAALAAIEMVDLFKVLG